MEVKIYVDSIQLRQFFLLDIKCFAPIWCARKFAFGDSKSNCTIHPIL